LVDRAWDHLRNNRRARRNDHDFDEIWCVFDRDDHEDIAGTLQMARDRGIQVAFSNPCFELWLVLHVAEQTAHVNRVEIQRRCRELGLTVGKRIKKEAVDRLLSGYAEAKQRACALAVMHEETGSQERNPGSDVWRLVDRLRGSD